MPRLITWFVDNSIAANLLMVFLLAGGIVGLSVTRQEEFPELETEMIQILVPYLGATPEEAEEAVCLRIEDAVDGTPGIEKITATASEGNCMVFLEIVEGTPVGPVVDQVKSLVDGIDTFPGETERPIVNYITVRSGVLQVALFGNLSEMTLRREGTRLRDAIAALPLVSQVELDYVRPLEISIEVSEATLQRHGLTFDQVAAAVRRSSVDLPGGSLKTSGGQILLRTKGQAYRGEDFEEIVVLTRADGTSLTVADVANVVDGFEDGDLAARFDGEPAVLIRVQRVGDEDTLEIARSVKAFIADYQDTLPAGLNVEIWADDSLELRYRIDSVLSSAGYGLALVLIVLALSLKFRLAFWVAAGIPIALLGAMFLFPVMNLTINTLSIMGFLLVLGIVVDDAIVVGERVYALERRLGDSRAAAIQGTSEVSIPVIFGVLTTLVAFLPFVMVTGRMGQWFVSLAATAAAALAMSLVESQLILPAHLAHRRTTPPRAGSFPARWSAWQGKIADGIEDFATTRYRPALELVAEWRYLALACGVGSLIILAGLFQGGWIVAQFFPAVELTQVRARITLPAGIPIDDTRSAVAQLEASAERLRSEVDADLPAGQASQFTHIFTSVGRHFPRRNGSFGVRPTAGQSHLAEVAIELASYDRLLWSPKGIASRWRELTGSIPDVVEVSFNASMFGAGEAINVQLTGADIERLRTASARVASALGGFDGVLDISDSFRDGKQEVKLELLDEARTLGLTQTDLARQVRQAFYGEEAQRVQRGADDIRVMVRFPEAERRSLGDLEQMRIRTADGAEVPFSRVAKVELGRGPASISRTDRRRVINVVADVDRNLTTPEQVTAKVFGEIVPALRVEFPEIQFSAEGEQRERQKAFKSLGLGFALALLAIYALLAIPLRSYAQPIVIMSAIPFGILGAILGHFLLGLSIVMTSFMGIVALSGVVVNDSLVLVDFINRERSRGTPVADAVFWAGQERFRAILLTSVTTFVGLSPLIFTSNPALGIVMHIGVSLGFGVILATVVTLFLVPCLYLIIEDIEQWRSARRGSSQIA